MSLGRDSADAHELQEVDEIVAFNIASESPASLNTAWAEPGEAHAKERDNYHSTNDAPDLNGEISQDEHLVQRILVRALNVPDVYLCKWVSAVLENSELFSSFLVLLESCLHFG